MDKSKIILRLQQLASTSSNTYELMTLAKAAEKLRAGLVKVVSTTASLPAAATSPVGEIFLVENDDDLYVNVGSQWNSLNNEISARLAYAWGYNSRGQLGDGTSGAGTAKSSPVTVIGGITNWSQLSAAAGDHSLGVTTTGIAYAWGSNEFGALGDGTTASRSSPVTVVGGITNWSQLAGASNHSLGLTSTGIAYAWGSNSYGQLGDGTITSRSSPVSVVGGITNWRQVSTRAAHNLGVTSTGIAYAWGRNFLGRLGDGTTIDRSSPVTVIGGITNWSQVSAGGQHSLGLTSTGIAYAWSRNHHGQLGTGTTTDTSSPVTVIGGITNWSQVSAGSNHSLGLTSTGIAYAWGFNDAGAIADGTTARRSSPVTVIGGITNWSQVSAGGYHSLGLTSTGITYAWGRGVEIQLGDGTTTASRLSPVTVVGGITNWSQVSAGRFHNLALRVIQKSI
jgi:alpha-tubulin suppressor-like RCC1 family protein